MTTGRRNSLTFIILVAVVVAVVITAAAYFFIALGVSLPKAENTDKQAEAILLADHTVVQQPEAETVPAPKITTKQKITYKPETKVESKVAPVTTSPPASPPASQSVFDPKSAGSLHPKIAALHPPCCSHPYWHQLYRAVSADGLNFKAVGGMIKDKASVPAILQKEDGSFILYYVDGRYDTLDCSVSSVA